MTEILDNFAVLEGLDGAGTTTQLRLLEKDLLQNNIPAFITQEPTSNPTGKLIRRFLSGELPASQSTIAHAFATDRDDHLYNPQYGIISRLKAGDVVISDRYLFSSIAYQGIGYNLDAVKNLNSVFPLPRYVIYVDTPVQACMDRIESRGSEKEIYEKKDYLNRVRENYENCFSSLPEGCILIRVDGTSEIEQIFNTIKRGLHALYD